MIAKCTTNIIEHIVDEAVRQHVQEYVHLSEVDLVVGDRYLIFGILFRQGIPWYLICEQPDDEYPRPYCSVLFDLLDATVPRGWQLTVDQSNVGANAVLPSEWATDPRFLEKLVEGDEQAASLFRTIKRRYQV